MGDINKSIESLDSTGRKKSFQRLCVRFAEKTSMQGVPYINSAKLKCSKVLWTILLLGAIGVMIFHLYYLCDQYFAWPILTKISLGFNNLRLPQVTLCNSNIIRKSKLHLASAKLQELVNDTNPDSMELAANARQGRKRKKRFIKKVKRMNLSQFDIIDYREEYEDYEGLGPEDDISEIEFAFRSMYMAEARDRRIDMGHDIGDMLISCSFNGRECYAENFTQFNTAEYGNCYTLKSDRLLVKQPGPNSGLRLLLYLENEEYLDGITDGYGLRMVLNSHNEFPFPADEGFFIHSFAENAIALKLVKIQRIGWPYRVCEKGATFRKTYGRPYSRQACQSLWKQSYILKKCNCYDPNDEELFVQSNISSLQECETRAEIKCLNRENAKFNSKTIKPVCNNPCREQHYVKTITTRPWPTDPYIRYLLEGVCEQQPSKCALLKSYGERQLGLNFAKIMVYYEDLNYEEIVEDPEIQLAQFLSDIGGALGLWIGLSVLSIFEVVQLLLELCGYCIHKCNKNKTKKPKSKNDRSERHERSNRHKDQTVNQYNMRQPIQSDNFRNDLYDSNPHGDSNYQPEDYQHVNDYYIYKGQQKL